MLYYAVQEMNNALYRVSQETDIAEIPYCTVHQRVHWCPREVFTKVYHKTIVDSEVQVIRGRRERRRTDNCKVTAEETLTQDTASGPRGLTL